MKLGKYLILISVLCSNLAFSMNPVVDLTDPHLLNHPGQEYKMKKSGLLRILRRWKYEAIKLDNLLTRLHGMRTNRLISEREFNEKKVIIINKIIAQQAVATFKIGQIIGQLINFNELVRIDLMKYVDLEQFADRLLS